MQENPAELNLGSDNELPQVSELDALKARADQMGITYKSNIGVDALRAKVQAKLDSDEPATADEADEDEEDASTAAPAVSAPRAEKESVEAFRRRKKLEAAELVRIRVTCMNPNKKEWEGEIFTVSNAIVGTHKKYVPFNSDEGWHVPRIILNQLQARQCQVFTSKRDGRGNLVREGKLIKEFAIEILPPLTTDELHDLAQRQAMAKSID